MKRIGIAILLFLFGIGAYLVFERASSGSTATVGATPNAPVEITSKTPGARVFIDGEGPFPLPYKDQLAIGAHELEFDAEGYESQHADIVVEDSKQVSIATADLQPLSNVLSFFPLITEPGVIAVVGNQQFTYYAIRDQIQDSKRFIMKAKFPGPIQKTLWNSSGYGLFLTSDGWHYYRPPVRHTKIDLPGEPLYVFESGKQSLSVIAQTFQYVDLETTSVTPITAVPPGAQALFGSPDPRDAYGIVVLKQGNTHSVQLINYSDKSLTLLEESIVVRPSVAISEDGTKVLYTTDTQAKSYITLSGTHGPSYAVNNTTGAAMVVTSSQGFIIFEPDTRKTNGEEIMAIYSVNPPSPSKTFALYDIVIPQRIDPAFHPTHIKGYGAIVAEKNGPLWYLGDPVNLPLSIFERSLPADIYKGH